MVGGGHFTHQTRKTKRECGVVRDLRLRLLHLVLLLEFTLFLSSLLLRALSLLPLRLSYTPNLSVYLCVDLVAKEGFHFEQVFAFQE